MPKGIIVFGANGSGKSTIGKKLAEILNYKYMDIEDYHFIKSKIPYTVERSNEECLSLMRRDINKYNLFVLCAVSGDFGEEICSMYKFAVFIFAPIDIRIQRIRQRGYNTYKERVTLGGDMYEQQLKFIDFVTTRSLSKMEQWAKNLTCPIIHIDSTKPIDENIKYILEQYLNM